MKWLLCDYGEVLSHPQPLEDQRLLEEQVGRFGKKFWVDYWLHRPGYDQGQTKVGDYWSAVLGRSVAKTELARIIECDVAGWLHFNPESLSAAARAAKRGLNLAILSNAPHEVADAIDHAKESALFTPRLFSCRIGINKPDRGVYVSALSVLGAKAQDVVFLDDRPDNVTAARRLGIKAQLFTDPDQIDAINP